MSSSATLDWGGGGGDYSFLMDSIEGTITSKSGGYLASSPAGGTKRSSAATPGSLKRTRLSIDDRDLMDDADTATYTGSLKLQAHNDELRILNDKLTEDLINSKADFAAVKDKMIKQLTFVEEANSRLKKESEMKSDKYYDEKKKWQAKIREFETQLKQQQQNASSSIESRISTLASNAANNDADITSRIRGLEREVMTKTRESREAAITINNMESEIFQLKQEAKLFHTLHLNQGVDGGENSSSSGNESQEMKDLIRMKNDLELTLKRKTRENEKLSTQLQNQQLLQEQNSVLQGELKIAQDKIKQHEVSLVCL